MTSAPPEIIKWLEAFSKAVRDEDYDAGKALFDNRVVSFGSVCFRAEGIEHLVEEQWRVVWSSTKEFDFDYVSALGTVDENTAAAVATWHSNGFDADARPIERTGRATVILLKTDDGLKAIHTHFSLAP